MKPELRPISLSIIDLFGILIPGAVWSTLLVYAWQLTGDAGQAVTLTALLGLTTGSASVGTSFYFAFAAFAFGVGFAVQAVAMEIADRIVAATYWLADRARLVIGRSPRRPFYSYRFPFPWIHDNAGVEKPYYKFVVQGIQEELPNDVTVMDLPGNPPFSVAKRMLKILRPDLWEESERAEAAVRLLGSLFLAALFSAVLNLIYVGGAPAVWSISVALFLGVAFNRQRHREVNYLYLNVVIVMGMRGKPTQDPIKPAQVQAVPGATGNGVSMKA